MCGSGLAKTLNARHARGPDLQRATCKTPGGARGAIRRRAQLWRGLAAGMGWQARGIGRGTEVGYGDIEYRVQSTEYRDLCGESNHDGSRPAMLVVLVVDWTPLLDALT